MRAIRYWCGWALMVILEGCGVNGMRHPAMPAPAAPSPLVAALHSAAPAAERAKELNLYAFLVGSWEMDIVAYDEAGKRYESRGEIHAGWVLEGRAIQDVWITPRRGERDPLPEPAVTGSWYGTTLRVYDAKLDAWHILWSDPATQTYMRQIGRAQGSEIVQQGAPMSGTVHRWRFTEIRPDSFHWLGEISTDDGTTWELRVDIRARRMRQAAKDGG